MPCAWGGQGTTTAATGAAERFSASFQTNVLLVLSRSESPCRPAVVAMVDASPAQTCWRVYPDVERCLIDPGSLEP